MSLEDYDRLKVIGKGSYGEVWLAKHRADKKQYVLKKMDLRKASKRERLAAEQEAKLLSNLKHPNIVAYKDTFEAGDGYLYIAMGYCERGDLYTRLKEQKGTPLEERHVVEWFVQIAMALQYMHERNILHRDLKTQNIFLTKNKIIKVGDLGIARVLDSSSDMATTLIGTPYYMSPELFSNKPYNFKSDVWALGCCVYEMTTLKHAFNAKDMNALMYRVLRGKLPPMPDMYRKELVDLIKAMLNKNPDKRPSVNRILRDPYIKENIAIFLEGTKTNTNSNRRPGSANKKDRPSSRDGNRPRRPKSEPQSLEPLNTGQDILEPIKEEATPRDSIDVRGSLSDHQKNNSKDSMDVNDNGPMEAKLEKRNSGRDGVGSSSEVLPQNSPLTADVEKPKRQHSSGSKNKERRSGKHSKLSKKGIAADANDESNVSAQEIEVFPAPNKVDQADLVSNSEKAPVVIYRRLNEDSNSDSAMTSVEKVRPSPSKRKSFSSKSKPPLPESRSSLSDFVMPLSEPDSPVIKSPSSSDFGLPKDYSPSVVPERRSSRSEPRSSLSSDSKPPMPVVSRSSASVPCPSRGDSSGYSSGMSTSKSRSSPSRRKSAEGDACLTEQQKSDSKCRPLPPRPTSSSINPEPSKAIIYKSSRVNQANGDSGRSSSTSSSGYSGREEVGDQLDDRGASESVSRASQEMPLPMRSIESSARQRRRLQQQQLQTPRISKSVDVTGCPPELFHDSGPAVTSADSSRQERRFRSVDYDNQHSRSEGEKKPPVNHRDPLESELEKLRIRNSSNGSGSSSEDEEESTSRAEKREEKKEIDSFINLLGTTLRLQKKSKDSDDEGDSGVEAIPETPKPQKPKIVCGATYLMSAPSPLPPGVKYPYVDENSVPISARNRRVRQRIPDESPHLDVPDRAVDPLDSAISMTTTGRLFDRISVLRKDCIHALGVEKLKIAYDILDCFDTDELEPQLVKLLGVQDFEAYAGKIFQLKFCEESAFKAQ